MKTIYKTAEIISASKKIKNTKDVLKNMDLILDLIKIDVQNIINKKSQHPNFDDFFNAATKKLIKNITKKKYLKGIQKIDRCVNIYLLIVILIKKITGMVKNEYNIERKNSYAQHYLKIKQELLDDRTTTEDPLNLIIAEEDEKEAKALSKNEVKRYKKIIIKNTKMEKKKNGYFQLCLIF